MARVEQFRRARGPAAMKYYELMQKSLEELMEPVLEAMPVEKLRERLTPEQRVEGLTIEQRLQGLSPEQLEELKRRLH
jgi:hypothetical protein